MKYRRLAQFSQVKTSEVVQSNGHQLFKKFKLPQIIKSCGIVKSKGYGTIEMLFLMLVMVLDRCRSINSGLNSHYKQKLKTPLNNMLNNKYYNWRNLLYRVAIIFKSYCPVREGDVPVLIIDDTAKEKTGHKGENSSWFINHCKQVYYKGFQTIVAAWSNGKVVIPLDFELKIGKVKIKRAKKTQYPKRSHTGQRERMAKQKKIRISLQFIKRALQRGFHFHYLLWDSWYNSSESLDYVFRKLCTNGIHLVSMLKRDQQIFFYKGKYLNIKRLYYSAGKMKTDSVSQIKYKSITVTLLDKRSHANKELQEPLGSVKMCFYKYPKNKKFKVIITTDTKLSEMEILGLYLRRWSIEVIFKDLKQHFGYDQSKSSKYAPQIADLTIRCVFYVMFCYLKDNNFEKSTEQIMFEFYFEMQETCLDIFSQLVFYQETCSFLNYAIKKGYRMVDDLLRDIDSMLQYFFEEQWGDGKICELDNHDFSKFRYKKAV